MQKNTSIVWNIWVKIRGCRKKMKKIEDFIKLLSIRMVK